MIVQGKRRIGQGSGNTKSSQRRPNPAKQDRFVFRPANNETSDQNPFTGENVSPRRKILKQRRAIEKADDVVSRLSVIASKDTSR